MHEEQIEIFESEIGQGLSDGWLDRVRVMMDIMQFRSHEQLLPRDPRVSDALYPSHQQKADQDLNER